MIGDIERIKRVGENSMKAKTLGGKKKPKRIVQPQRIGATHVPRNVSNYDGMVENLPTMEPPIVGATSQLERMQEDNRLQRLEMKVSSMGNDISTMSRDISTMSRDMAMLATLLAPGAKAGGREYRETVQPPPRASTSGALQSSNIGGQANVKLSPYISELDLTGIALLPLSSTRPSVHVCATRECECSHVRTRVFVLI